MLVDQLILGADRFLRKLNAAPKAERPSPATNVEAAELEEEERKHAAGLMRINHTGEVCAQALYEGQALAATSSKVRSALLKAAAEEEDHLAWCSERLVDLESEASKLNPIFFAASYALGMVTGAMGDKISLGFVAATEEQVCKHLKEHMSSLPASDERSRCVIRQMYDDEKRHGTQAIESGGVEFPAPIKTVMTLVSKLMTSTTYRI